MLDLQDAAVEQRELDLNDAGEDRSRLMGAAIGAAIGMDSPSDDARQRGPNM